MFTITFLFVGIAFQTTNILNVHHDNSYVDANTLNVHNNSSDGATNVRLTYNNSENCHQILEHSANFLFGSLDGPEIKSIHNLKFNINDPHNYPSNHFNHYKNEEDLKKFKLRIADKFTCHICFSKEIECIIKPCKHVLCFCCFSKMKACPFCRGKIEDIDEIFIA